MTLELTCTEALLWIFHTRRPDMGYQPLGHDIMVSLLPLVTHMQNYHINAKYTIKCVKLAVSTQLL